MLQTIDLLDEQDGGHVTESAAANKRSTLSDVARLAGVDPSLVSRLLNDDPRLKIRDETRERVLRAIRMLDYKPNQAARSLRTAKTRSIGMFIPDFGNPAYAEIIRGAERAAARAGTALVTGSMSASDVLQGSYLDLFGHGRIDGLLIATDGLVSGEGELERIGVPWLFTNRTGSGQRRYVILDDDRAMQIAVDHLIELGHHRVGLVSGPDSNYSARRRERAFLETARARGLMVPPGSVVRGDFASQGGAQAMEEILRLEVRPTAVVASNVASAIGALFAAHRAGVAVPEHMSVIAIHDLPLAANLVPPLTTVRMPLEGLGQRAIELLLNRDADEDIREIVQDPTVLIARESTAPPAL